MLTPEDINQIADAVVLKLRVSPSLNKTAAAIELGVSSKTIQRMVRDGRLLQGQDGKIPLDEIIRYKNR